MTRDTHLKIRGHRFSRSLFRLDVSSFLKIALLGSPSEHLFSKILTGSSIILACPRSSNTKDEYKTKIIIILYFILTSKLDK